MGPASRLPGHNESQREPSRANDDEWPFGLFVNPFPSAPSASYGDLVNRNRHFFYTSKATRYFMGRCGAVLTIWNCPPCNSPVNQEHYHWSSLDHCDHCDQCDVHWWRLLWYNPFIALWQHYVSSMVRFTVPEMWKWAFPVFTRKTIINQTAISLPNYVYIWNSIKQKENFVIDLQ